MSEDLLDQAPLYGMGEVDYATSKQIAEFYINNYTDVKFNDPVWLPGIDTGSMSLDGSVRAYGHGQVLEGLQEGHLLFHHIIILILLMEKLYILENILMLQA